MPVNILTSQKRISGAWWFTPVSIGERLEAGGVSSV